MTIKIPFNFWTEIQIEKMDKPWMDIGAGLEKGFPNLKIELEQAGINYSTQTYLGIASSLFAVYASVFAVVFTGVLLFTGSMFWFLGIFAGILLGLLVGIQVVFFPKILIKRKVREIEQNLIYAVRTLLIQVKSGVGLFQAMNIVAEEEYGVLSQEFKKTVQKINSGIHQDDALQEMALDNPSPSLRKVIWQIINGIKGGAEISYVLQESLNSMVRDQLIDIRKYGSQLRLDSLIYMMIGVILPALGLTFLIVLGSIPQIQITEIFFWGLLAGVIIMNYFFIGIMKSRRPALL
ncbi:MAG: type II secretion system F family protein [Candidatus Diapherotrites archaeon]|nr:type II secretion system F family protein [Candidatus Diapherotrites archaeon]